MPRLPKIRILVESRPKLYDRRIHNPSAGSVRRIIGQLRRGVEQGKMFQYQRGVEARMVPVHAPIQMRARGPAASANQGHFLTLLHQRSLLHQYLTEVNERC